MSRTELTRKERILRLVQEMPDDVSFDRVIEELDLLRAIAIGIEQVERGETTPHEEFVAELRATGWLDDAPASSDPTARKKTSKRSAGASTPAPTPVRRGRS